LSYFDQAIVLESEQALEYPWQNKAYTLLRLGRFDEAEVLYQQAMTLNIRIGDDEGLAHTLRGLGEIAWRRGDAGTAEKHLRDNEALCGKLNDMRGLSWTAQQLGNAARTHEDWHAAAARYAEALAQMDRMGDRWGACEVLAECGHLAVATSRFELAAYWIGMAQTGFRALDAKLTPYESGLIAADLQRCAAHLEPEVLQQALERGAQGWHERDTAQLTVQ
jgi:tetratricopeptide (TPR) repeat protein